jgi:hypothetical protein
MNKKSTWQLAFGMIAYLFIAGGCFTATSDRNDMDRELVWENNLFDRIGIAPVGGGLSMEDYWVWGSSVVRGDDHLYHMYVSRWPKNLPFHPGWMIASEVAHAVSETAEGPYRFVDVALPARGAQYWDGRSTHNPRVLKHKDLYVLYYMGSTHPFDEISNPDTLTLSSPYCVLARANKRIGIATSKSPYGPWERRDKPVLETQPGTFYSFLTSNPAPWIEEDGSASLIFKSRQYKETFPYQSHMMIGVAKAKHFEGPYEVHPEPIFGVDKMGEIEDPFIWKDENGFHMIAKDQRGTITGNWHDGLLAHSRDGIEWVADKSPLAYTRVIKWNDGQEVKMGQLERAFGLIQDGKLTHLFFATMDGPGGFNNSTRSWNMVLPLK